MESVFRSNKYRDYIMGVDKLVPIKNGDKVVGINFDNAATTPPFKSVVREVVKFSSWYSSVHRGTGYKSQISSKFYDESRDIILRFVNADLESHTVVFVKNATEGINKLSYRLLSCRDCVVLSTWMEHHSNDLPWRDKCNVDYVDIDAEGRLKIDDLEQKLKYYKGAVKLVTVTGASNVTGYVNDIHKIAALAHKYKARILVDGAQMVPHMRINMMPERKEEQIDFLVFSAHKMYAPFGIGVIVAPKKCLECGCPEYKGGGTVHVVTHKYVDWDEPPFKDEAGSPNLIGVKALVTAINEFNKIGMENIEKHEHDLTWYALKGLNDMKNIEIYGDLSGNNPRVGIIPFNMIGISHQEVAKYLSEGAGIAVRSGCFCAHPYVQRLLNIPMEYMDAFRNNKDLQKPGMVRVSFGIYNTAREVDVLIKYLKKLDKNRLIRNY
jgi:cysteine desulfurase / selenocysteine lyase